MTVKADKGATVTIGDKAVLVGGSFVEKLGTAKITGDTNVTVTGEGEIVLGKGIVGGTYVGENYADKTENGYEASVITGSTNILIDGAKVTANDEIIGGTYMRSVSRSETGDKKASIRPGRLRPSQMSRARRTSPSLAVALPASLVAA